MYDRNLDDSFNFYEEKKIGPEVKHFFMKGLRNQKILQATFQRRKKQKTNFYDPFKADVYSLGILTLKLLDSRWKNVLNSLEWQNIDRIFQKKRVLAEYNYKNASSKSGRSFSFARLLSNLSKFGSGEKPDESLMAWIF